MTSVFFLSSHIQHTVKMNCETYNLIKRQRNSDADDNIAC